MSDLAYLLTAQRLVKRDKVSAMSRLGIRLEMAELLEHLSPQQMSRVAASGWPVDVPSAGLRAGASQDTPQRMATIRS